MRRRTSLEVMRSRMRLPALLTFSSVSSRSLPAAFSPLWQFAHVLLTIAWTWSEEDAPP